MNSPAETRYKRILTVGIGLILLAAIIFAVYENVTAQKEARTMASALGTKQTSQLGEIEIGGKRLKVDIASTPAERSQGLSDRQGLAEGTGMLFVFDMPGEYVFWMKDMLFSIDMIWINAEKKIVHIEKDVSPDTYPKTFAPSAPALYVLEVPAGFSEKQSLAMGDEVKFLKGF